MELIEGLYSLVGRYNQNLQREDKGVGVKDFLITHGLWIFLVLLALIFIIVIFLPAPSEGSTFTRVWTIEEVRETYNTPEKLGQFIRRQFVSGEGFALVSPETVIERKEGNCKSIANFVKTILEPLGYDCEIVPDNREYNYGRSHCVCEVRDGDKVWVFSGTEYRRK